MPLQYGLNFTASDIKNMLVENDKRQSGIRSWAQLFGNASLGQQAQSNALRSDYSDIIAQAYKANFEQQNAIRSSGLSEGAIKQALNMSRQDLSNTYNAYLQNYQQNLAEIDKAYSEEVGIISGALDERAQNFANLYNSAYDYLSSELFGATMTYDDQNNPIYTEGKNPEITGYEQINRDYLTEHNLAWVLDEENGNVKDWNTLSKLLVDDNGYITDQGRQFFDALFNATPQEYMRTDEKGNEYQARSFDKWLSDTNPELREWLASADAFNYTFNGSNLGTAKAMLGMESTDYNAETNEMLDTSKGNKTSGTSNRPTYKGSPYEGSIVTPVTAGKYMKWVHEQQKNAMDRLEYLSKKWQEIENAAREIGIDTTSDDFSNFVRYLNNKNKNKKLLDLTTEEFKELYQEYIDTGASLKTHGKENPNKNKPSRPSGF